MPCALAAEERESASGWCSSAAALVAYVPYAARWPYEVHVTLLEHRPSLLDCTRAELRELADGAPGAWPAATTPSGTGRCRT